jgi:hypothetical protein
MARRRTILDGLNRIDFGAQPDDRRERRRGRDVPTDVRGMMVLDLGKGRYEVWRDERVERLERGRVEVRVGGRKRRNLIRWLIGYVGGVLTAILLGFVSERPAWLDLQEGLHFWLDHLIRRAGAAFMFEAFRIIELKLARA